MSSSVMLWLCSYMRSLFSLSQNINIGTFSLGSFSFLFLNLCVVVVVTIAITKHNYIYHRRYASLLFSLFYSLLHFLLVDYLLHLLLRLLLLVHSKWSGLLLWMTDLLRVKRGQLPSMLSSCFFFFFFLEIFVISCAWGCSIDEIIIGLMNDFERGFDFDLSSLCWMGSKICMNSSCGAATSNEWKKGWPLRSGGFAHLCYTCGYSNLHISISSTFWVLRFKFNAFLATNTTNLDLFYHPYCFTFFKISQLLSPLLSEIYQNKY